jgi:hypothetical protein
VGIQVKKLWNFVPNDPAAPRDEKRRENIKESERKKCEADTFRGTKSNLSLLIVLHKITIF